MVAGNHFLFKGTGIVRRKTALKRLTSLQVFGIEETCCWAFLACGMALLGRICGASDLGLLISNNGIHFREPIADHVLFKAGQSQDWDRHGLIQGQGFENVGEKTYIYYGTWDLTRGEVTPGAIGLATLRRDGFGYLSTRLPGEGLLTTVPLARPSADASLSINAEGLGEDSYLRCELIDKYGAGISGFSGAATALVKKSGLKEPVTWQVGETLSFPDSPFRVRVRFAGRSADKIKFYGAYVQ